MFRTASDLTIFTFGLMAILAGLIGLLTPETMLSLINFVAVDRTARQDGDYTITFLIASSMASLNMGIYYVLAAWNQWTEFYQFTVVFRLLTAVVFSLTVMNGHAPKGFLGIAMWEFMGALITGAALWFETNRSRSTIKKTR